jgi:hypothetical protein
VLQITKAGVPSSSVIVGVTSYGRSFEMSDASCWTEECSFTGGQDASNAAAGLCTGTAGYISNAEIQDILNDPTRVNQNYLDEGSNTNILVYDNVQWVGYMDSTLKSSRHNLYQGLNMGGSTDWATDLEVYNDVPYPATSWADFIADIENGQDPLTEYEVQTGTWATIQCDVPAANDWMKQGMSAETRWALLDGSNAWSDLMNEWVNVIEPTHNSSFTVAIVDMIHGDELTACENVGPGSNCQQTEKCWANPAGADGAPANGAVSSDIWNSFVLIHEVCMHRH